MLLTAAITLLVLAGTGLPVVTGLSEQGPRDVRPHAIMAAILVVAGVVAAILASHLPAPLIGLLGLLPVIGGLRRLANRPFTALRRGYERPGLGSVAVPYLTLVASRAAGEVVVASVVLVVVAALQVLAARAPAGGPPGAGEVLPAPARLARLLRHGETVAAWTQVALGAYLLIDGGALAMLKPF